ncbi:MAG: glucose-6-phosphate dehydrogenase, partial [Candidatus Competibacteraceae bacterium]|nr:glucose-6-phosphate dehydrogenase [Candidatus Competibacteraceae bacterium]
KTSPPAMQPDRLVIHLQPDEGVKLFLIAPEPGDALNLRLVHLNLDFAEIFKPRRLDAYELLLMDVIRGNLALFLRGHELEESWRWAEPILQVWAWVGFRTLYRRHLGSSASAVLIGRNGHSWHKEL